MEKFALLDFLKAFQSLTAKTGGAPNADDKAEKEQPAPTAPQSSPPPQPQFYETNPMADVIARHEEIANRIRNNRR